MKAISMIRRTMLFVPSDRFDRIHKSIELEADSIVLDLEDAVSPSNKEKARNFMARALLELDFKGKEKVVRINSPRTLWGLQDISFLSSLTCFPDTILVPKVESPGEIVLLASLLEEINSEIEIMPLLESAQGIFEARQIATASPKINGLLFGGGDLSGELGCQMEWDCLYHARAVIILAAVSAKVDVLDVPYLDVNNLSGLEVETKKAAKMGFTGKAVIHPKQIDIVNRVFSPEDSEIDWAKRVVAAAKCSESGALIVDGKMIDAAIVKKADKILQCAQKLSLL